MPNRALTSFSRVLIDLLLVVWLQLANRNRPPETEGTPLSPQLSTDLPLGSQKVVQGIMRRLARRAGAQEGVHILRHTFCSHLAMQGAPSRAIQELAGHRDPGTTQRYMHLSPAALEAAIRLLERSEPGNRGANGEAAGISG